MRFPSPPSSAPSTLKFVVVPVTGSGDADAVEAMVGEASLIVMEAIDWTEPLAAATAALPAEAGDVYKPPLLMLPSPETRLQVNAGCGDKIGRASCRERE